MEKKEFIGICIVLLLGLTVAVGVSTTEKKAVVSEHGHDHGHGDHAGHAHEANVGPHGGKVIKDGMFHVELVLYEKGGPPHFRVYVSNDGKPVDPKEVKLSIELERLGEKTTTFDFKAGPDYLYSEKAVEEPHSFFVKILAQWKDQEFDWQYTQYEDRLTLSPELAEKVRIESETAAPGVIRTVKTLPGEIALNGDRVAHVVPRVPGIVVETRKSLGDHVQKGDVLAVISARELADARSKYLVALEREKLARYNFERGEKLWEKQTIPEKEFLTTQKAFLEEKIELASAARKLATLGLSEEEINEVAEGNVTHITHSLIRAPFDGVIVKKHLSPGEWVKDDAELFVVADLTDVWVEITVYSKDLASIHVGQKASVFADCAGLETEGTVSYVEPFVGEQSRTAKARVVIPNTDGKWRPGLFAKVRLVSKEHPAPLVVRNEAIQTFHTGKVVFVNYEDQYEPRPVTLGLSDETFTEVLTGLDPGDRYVARNSFIVKAELGKAGVVHEH